MNQTFYYVKQENGDYILDNFPTNLKYLINNYQESKEAILVHFEDKKQKARIGKNVSREIEIFVLTFDPKFVNRLKFFRDLVESSFLYITPILHLQENIKKKHKETFDDFVHNVISINSYSIQNLFALLPQNLLSDNINKQKDIIKEIIKVQPNVTVETLLKQIKYSMATKVEFSVFQHIVQNSSIFHKQSHNIRIVVLSILQIFIEDFDQKRIEVSLSASDKMLDIDYDSIFVSLYYIFDNAIKYCCPSTKFKIIFSEESNSFDIIFKMVSIKIIDSEIDLLTDRGYRSNSARELNDKGLGIGMFRIVKTLRLNKAELRIIPRSFIYTKTVKNIDYEGNEFRIVFRNQNNWFN